MSIVTSQASAVRMRMAFSAPERVCYVTGRLLMAYGLWASGLLLMLLAPVITAEAQTIEVNVFGDRLLSAPIQEDQKGALTTTIRVAVGNVRAHADINSAILFKLRMGAMVQILSWRGDWYHIRLPDGRTGWANRIILTPFSENSLQPEASQQSLAVKPVREKPAQKRSQSKQKKESTKGPAEQGHDEYIKGNYEEALSLFQAALKEEPKNAQARYYIGLTYQGMLDYQQASQSFKGAVQLAPDMGDAWAHLGEMLYRLKQFKQAQSALEHAIANGARPGYAHYIQGLVLLELGKYDAAIQALQIAQRKNPGFTQKATYAIGMAHLRQQDRRAAEKAFREAAAINPSSSAGVYANYSLSGLNSPAKRTWYVDASYHLQYDSNVVLNPSGPDAAFIPTGQGDFTHILNVNANISPEIQGPWSFRVDGNYYKSIHHKLRYMDLDGLSLSMTPSRRVGPGTLSMTGRGDTYWVGRRLYLSIFGAYPSWSFTIGKDQQGMLSAGVQKKKYFHQAQLSVFPEQNRNANNYSAGYTHYLYFSAHRAYAGVGYKHDVENARGRDWDYRGDRFTGMLFTPVPGALSLRVSADYYIQYYWQINSVYHSKRRDKTLTAASLLTYDYSKWLKFQLQYTYVSARSNIGVYQYIRHIVGGGIEVNY